MKNQNGKNNPNWKGGKVKSVCIYCGKIFEDFVCRNRKFCSNLCASRFKSESLISENGGKHKHSEGYIYILIGEKSPFISMRSCRHYCLEHRLIMAQNLGRCLTSEEIVHHKNGIKDDNRLENLELLIDNRHNSLNARMKTRSNLGKFILIK